METTTSHLYEAAAHFFSGAFSLEPLGRSSGYSGSQFARIEDSMGRKWCLRGWPEQLSDSRLRLIHRVLLHSRAEGFSGVPMLRQLSNGNTFVQLGAYRYEVQEWLPGKPCGSKRTFGDTLPNSVYRLSRSRLMGVTGALAHFHRSTVDLQPEENDYRQSLYQRFLQVQTEFSAMGRFVGTHEKAVSASLLIQKWLTCLPLLLSMAEALIEAYPEAAHRTDILCHGDIWPPHVFFDGVYFAGFADFESLTYASPVTDLAQLILHFNGWGAHQQALHAYQSQNTLGVDEVTLLPLAAILDLVGEACWSIEALLTSSENRRQHRAHQKNLLTLYPSAEQILEQMRA